MEHTLNPYRIALFGLITAATIGFGAQAAEINGAGATFPYPIYAKWAEAYAAKTGVKINYQSIGSGGGIKQITEKTVDFGASDMPLKAADLEKEGLIQFPMVMGGVVPVVNIEGIKPGQLNGAGNDPNVCGAVGHSSDDFIAETFFQVDVDFRMRRQECAQRLWEEFRQRVGIRHQLDVPFEPSGKLRKLSVHPIHLLQQQARVMNKSPSGRRGLHALAFALKERRSKCLLHVADARTGSGQRQVSPLGAGGDASGCHDVQE